MKDRPSNRRQQEPGSPGRHPEAQALRRQDWADKTPQEILAGYPPEKTPPLKVLEVLLELFNTLHTSLEKTVSHKTRYDRAQFLRRFFRDLGTKAGFQTVPDPRNLAQKHIHAILGVWQQEHLAPATIQTYMCFLRGLSMWMGKHGFIRAPEHYGLDVEEYQRHEVAQRDKSWSAQGIDIDAVIARACNYDRYVGASLRLIQTMGLRRKESVMFRPFESLVPFDATQLPPEEKSAECYVKTKGKGGRVRWVPVDSPERIAAIEFAQATVGGRDAHMGNPANDLKQNLRRFSYVMEKFGITYRDQGATGHGLRHETLNDSFEDTTGTPSPVRGGGPVPPELDRAARLAVAKLAGHARIRSAAAYLGAMPVSRKRLGGSQPGDHDKHGSHDQNHR